MKVRILPIFIVMLLYLAQARAYVYPGPSLPAEMIRSLGEAQTLSVGNEVVSHGGPAGSKSEKTIETVRFKFSEGFYSRARSVAAERILIVSGDRSLSILNGEPEPEAETRFDKYKDPLLYKSPEKLAEILAKNGMDIEVSSLGRFEGEIVFVIGAAYPDGSVSQLWIDKKTFRPCRMILAGGDSGIEQSRLDIRYRDWRQVGLLWHPSRIEFYQGDDFVREIRAASLNLDLPLEPNLFDIGAYLSGRTQGPDNTPFLDLDSEMEKVERIVYEFGRMYE